MVTSNSELPKSDVEDFSLTSNQLLTRPMCKSCVYYMLCPSRQLPLLTNPLLRVKAKITVKTPSAVTEDTSHPAFLTVNSALTVKSAVPFVRVKVNFTIIVAVRESL